MPKDDPNGPQGRRNQEMRDLRNEIFALTRTNRDLVARNTALEGALSDLMDGLNLFTDPPKEALAKICNMPALEAVRAGIAKELTTLAVWFNETLVASGKYEIGHLLARSDTPEEIREHLTRLRQAVR